MSLTCLPLRWRVASIVAHNYVMSSVSIDRAENRGTNNARFSVFHREEIFTPLLSRMTPHWVVARTKSKPVVIDVNPATTLHF